jgi:hypothetical protein
VRYRAKNDSHVDDKSADDGIRILDHAYPLLFML